MKYPFGNFNGVNSGNNSGNIQKKIKGRWNQRGVRVHQDHNHSIDNHIERSGGRYNNIPQSNRDLYTCPFLGIEITNGLSVGETNTILSPNRTARNR